MQFIKQIKINELYFFNSKFTQSNDRKFNGNHDLNIKLPINSKCLLIITAGLMHFGGIDLTVSCNYIFKFVVLSKKLLSPKLAITAALTQIKNT